MPPSTQRWVLAFEASCATCLRIANTVADNTRGRLEVLPLTHPDVERWRGLAQNSEASGVPTVLCVDDTGVRVWTGARMAIRLTAHLGVRSTLRVVRALGQLHQESRSPCPPGANRPGLRRGHFLRIGAGAILASGIVLTGRSPALGSPENREIEEWLQANKGNLPTAYDDVIAYSHPYRRKIFSESSPEVKSGLWAEQLQRYSASHSRLSGEQTAVLEEGLGLLAVSSTFAATGTPSEELHTRLERLRTSAVERFGPEEARSLFATLGPVEAQAPGCACSTVSDWCGGYCQACCDSNEHYPDCLPDCSKPCCCNYLNDGCGTGWRYQCAGACYS